MKKGFFLIIILLNSSCGSVKFLNDYSSLKSYDKSSITSKIDLNNFSSGPDAESPLGVTLPTKMSPAFTSAPIYTIPDSVF